MLKKATIHELFNVPSPQNCSQTLICILRTKYVNIDFLKCTNEELETITYKSRLGVYS